MNPPASFGNQKSHKAQKNRPPAESHRRPPGGTTGISFPLRRCLGHTPSPIPRPHTRSAPPPPPPSPSAPPSPPRQPAAEPTTETPAPPHSATAHSPP